MVGDIWIHSKEEMTIHIPEIKELANAMNKVANELAKVNNTNRGKHAEGIVEKVEEEL